MADILLSFGPDNELQLLDIAVAIALLSAVGFGIWLAIAWHRFEADVQTSR